MKPSKRLVYRFFAIFVVVSTILGSPLSVGALTEINKTTSKSSETIVETYWNKDKSGGVFRFETGLEQKLTPEILLIGELCPNHGLVDDPISVVDTATSKVLSKANLQVQLYEKRVLVHSAYYTKGSSAPSISPSSGGCCDGYSYAKWIAENGLDAQGKPAFSKIIILGDGLQIGEWAFAANTDSVYYDCAKVLKTYYDNHNVILLTPRINYKGRSSSYFYFNDESLDTAGVGVKAYAFFAPTLYLSLCDSSTKSFDMTKFHNTFWPGGVSSTKKISDASAISRDEFIKLEKTDYDYMDQVPYDNATAVSAALGDCLTFTYDKVSAKFELSDGVNIDTKKGLVVQYKTSSGKWTNIGKDLKYQLIRLRDYLYI